MPFIYKKRLNILLKIYINVFISRSIGASHNFPFIHFFPIYEEGEYAGGKYFSIIHENPKKQFSRQNPTHPSLFIYFFFGFTRFLEFLLSIYRKVRLNELISVAH